MYMYIMTLWIYVVDKQKHRLLDVISKSDSFFLSLSLPSAFPTRSSQMKNGEYLFLHIELVPQPHCLGIIRMHRQFPALPPLQHRGGGYQPAMQYN
jgi:hypothetical protein